MAQNTLIEDTIQVIDRNPSAFNEDKFAFSNFQESQNQNYGQADANLRISFVSTVNEHMSEEDDTATESVYTDIDVHRQSLYQGKIGQSIRRQDADGKSRSSSVSSLDLKNQRSSTSSRQR